MTGWSVLCVITGAHGVSGRVKVKPFTESPENITAYGELSDQVGKTYALEITGSAKGQLICAIEGVNDRNVAEKMRGLELGVPSDRLPEPDADSYYIDDLVGLKVLQDGAEVGTIKGVQNFGAGDLVEIAFTKGKPQLFAFTHTTFPEVDLSAQTVHFSPPEIIIAKEEDDEV